MKVAFLRECYDACFAARKVAINEGDRTCRLVAICEDIYAARAAGELELEEGLFWTLIKIYRAPYILMEYTKVE